MGHLFKHWPILERLKGHIFLSNKCHFLSQICTRDQMVIYDTLSDDNVPQILVFLLICYYLRLLPLCSILFPLYLFPTATLILIYQYKYKITASFL